MSKILYGTQWVSPDEPCLGLYEMDEQSPGSQGFHRYEIIYVMRGDMPAQYRIDLGKSSDFKTDPIRVLGGVWDEVNQKYYIEHSVAQCREMRDQMRFVGIDKRELAQMDRIR